MPTLLEHYKQRYAAPAASAPQDSSLRSRLYQEYVLQPQSAPPAPQGIELQQMGGGQTSAGGSMPTTAFTPSRLTPFPAEEALQRAGAMPAMFDEGQTLRGTLAQTPGKYINLGKSILNDQRASKAVDAEVEYYKRAALGSHEDFANAFRTAEVTGNADRLQRIVQQLRANPEDARSDDFRELVRSEMGLAGGNYPKDFSPSINSPEAATLVANIALAEAEKVDAPPEARTFWQKVGGVAGGLAGFTMELGALRRAGVPTRVGFGVPGAVAAADAGQDATKAFIEGAAIGGAMGLGGKVAGAAGEAVGAGAMTAGQGGTPEEIATMALVPLAMRAPGAIRNRIQKRAVGAAISRHELAIEAARRSMPGGGGKETQFDAAERIAAKPQPSRSDLPTVRTAEDRVRIAEELRVAHDAQKKLDERTAEIKKIKNKKKRERILRSDPIIMEQLQRLSYLMKTPQERAADAEAVARLHSEAFLEFEQDLMDTLAVKAGVTSQLAYARKWSRTRPPKGEVAEPDLSRPAPMTEPVRPERPPPDLGEGIFTSPGERPVELRGEIVQPFGPQRTGDTPRAPLSAPPVSETQLRAPQYGPESLRLVGLGDVLGEMRRGVSAASAFWKKYFTAGGPAPFELKRQEVRRQGELSREMKAAAFAERDFTKAVKDTFGRVPTEAERETINAVLVGDAPWTVLPPGLQASVKAIRRHVDALTQIFLDEGIVEGELAAVLESNRGVYLNRAYEVFRDPKWAEKVHPAIRNNFKAWLRGEHPDWNESQLEQAINELLFAGKAANYETPMEALRAAQLGQKNLSILRERKDLPEALRRLWGEIKDPLDNYRRSVFKMASMISNHRMLTRLRDEGMGKYFWPENDPKIDPNASAVIAKGDYRMTPLAGLRTYPEIEKAIREWYEPADTPWALRWYLKGMGSVKAGKTILSPKTQMRNFVANPLQLLANGTLSPRDFVEGLRTGWRDFFNKGNASQQAELLKYYELGLIGDSAAFGEFKAITRDIVNRGVDAIEDFWAGKRHAKDIPAQLYRLADDVYKVTEFRNKMREYRKAIPESEVSTPELERHVSEMVRNTLPTYSMVPRLVQQLRRFPLTGPFPSFYWEIFRTTYHRNRYMMKELADPRLRRIGAQRLIGQAIAYGLPTATALGTAAWWGVRKQTRDDLREFLAPWDENSELMLLDGNNDGEFTFVSLSYTDPFASFKESAIAFMRGEGAVEAAAAGAAEALRPFVQEEILTQALLDISRNTKASNGAPVYNPQDAPLQQAQDVLNHIWKAVEPGFASDLRREYLAQLGYKDASGRAYPKWITLGAMATGLRVQTLDVRNALKWRGKQFARELSEANSILLREAGFQGTVTPDAIADAHGRMESARRKLFANMVKKVNAARRLGISDREIRAILKDGNVSESMARAILREDYPAYDPGRILEGQGPEMRARRTLVRRLAREAARAEIGG